MCSLNSAKLKNQLNLSQLIYSLTDVDFFIHFASFDVLEMKMRCQVGLRVLLISTPLQKEATKQLDTNKIH